jgi:hypothetical protein
MDVRISPVSTASTSAPTITSDPLVRAIGRIRTVAPSSCPILTCLSIGDRAAVLPTSFHIDHGVDVGIQQEQFAPSGGRHATEFVDQSPFPPRPFPIGQPFPREQTHHRRVGQ